MLSTISLGRPIDDCQLAAESGSKIRVEPEIGIEPMTCGLQNRCSAD
jgi:hypothetical protein